MTKQEILDAYQFRFACKNYDPTRKISDEDMQFILETGRLSPSSFGFEPWRFIVVDNLKLRTLIAENAWGAAEKAIHCSHFVLILARQQATLNADSDYILHLLQDVHQMPPDIINQYQGFFRHFSEQDFVINESPRAFYDWASKQTYIALANMLKTAAMLGIDSTPIEGFPLEKMHQLLAEQGIYDPNEFKLSVMAAFGYRKENPKRPKTRQSFNDVVQWIK